ncbi:SpoIIE family protein phosphatase/ATP-binding protein [Streptomyces palmae]|uniref:SpoIIE family protein phosphatase/ATP-binding protein n=1 Tax=Streptomyces palmae TaxID=1701085 RepID=UPI001FD73945|nr:SpoIIE family protein phosphatase/ATP-binding protein [Streptomyces palmae]
MEPERPPLIEESAPRRRAGRGARTVAGQVFVLQVAVVLLIVLGAVAALLLQSRHDSDQEARHRSLAVAVTFAHSPGVVEALRSPDPTALLQPRAEEARKASGVDFLVVMTPQGIRYTHPDTSRIGRHFMGTTEPALRGDQVVETYTGTLGPSVRAVVPVTDIHGEVVGLVSAGITVDKVSGVVDRQLPLLLGAAIAALLLATGGTALVSRRLRRQTHGLDPVEITRMYEHHDAVLHSVREGVLIMDGERRLVLANDEARRLLDLPPDAEGMRVAELGLNPRAASLLVSGRTATDEVHVAGERLLSLSHRPTDRDGGPPGSVATLRDTTELHTLTGKVESARRRLKLLYDASLRIGTGLDVARTAEELAEYAVPLFADYVTVDLSDEVLNGEEPIGLAGLRRTALSGIRPDAPLYPLGSLVHIGPTTPQAVAYASGKAAVEAELGAFRGWQAQDPERARRIVECGIHSMITVPLRARGVVLGMATFWRESRPQPFEDDDLSLAEELVARAAVSIDNARRYTREHTMAVTLQRSLLPRVLPEQNALDVAYRYLPAQSGVGGDWFDVIPLPGARVALVVGDVVGHGLHAAATMGRLRTAVHNFSALDLPPDELLTHLDELIARIDQEDEEDEPGGKAITGATCLYAIYDPVSRRCTMARAGHPPPALAHRDGTVEFVDLPSGPPLGLGGLPFETAEFDLPEGSSVVLYTDGLIEKRDRDIDAGLELLRASLSVPGRTPEQTCQAVLEDLLQEPQGDDVALIVARTRVLPAERIAEWQLPAEPSEVAAVRGAVARQLTAWGLAEAAFSTELILSELVTNAIRHAAGPIRVRLLCDRTLICEVADTGSTAPHLRYAATTDEGGRGLFLVSQFAERWGTRYTPEGKVIWTEQPLPERKP